MRITGTKKIVVEDYPADSREVIQKLSQILNPNLEQSTQATNGNITLNDNLKSQVYSRTLASGTNTVNLKWTLNERPTEVRIAQIIRSDGTLPAVHILHWLYEAGQIACTVVGLDTAEHKLTIIAQV